MSAGSSRPRWGRQWDVFLWQRTLRRGVRLGKINPTDLAVAIALAEYADHGAPTGARPMTYTLGQRLGLHQDTISSSLNKLTRVGLLALVKRGGGTGPSARGSLRELTLPDWALDAAELEENESDAAWLNSRRQDREMGELTAELTGELTASRPPPTELTEPTSQPPNPLPAEGGGQARRRRRSSFRDTHEDHWANGGTFDGPTLTSTRPTSRRTP